MNSYAVSSFPDTQWGTEIGDLKAPKSWVREWLVLELWRCLVSSFCKG